MKRKSILKFVSLLGIGSFVALASASCTKTIKKDETTKPSKPSKPANPGTDISNSNGMDNTNPPAQPNNSEEKNKLSTSIATKNTNVALYSDYSVIKATLEKAYNDAQTIYDKDNASKEELVAAKNELETAIAKAKTDKDTFNSSNTELVNAYNTLKEKVKAKDTNLSLVSDAKYTGIKDRLDSLYMQASEIISKTLQASPAPTTESITMLSNSIGDAVSKIADWKNVADQYSTFKTFEISDFNENFKGDFKYTAKPSDSQRIVSYSSDFNNDEASKHWRYARRSIAKESDKEEIKKITKVSWIYNLDTADNPSDAEATQTQKTTATYNITFKYYGGSNATLYFPYKAIKTDQTGDNAESKLSLKYKLNDQENATSIDIKDAKVDDIKVKSINLEGLKFGDNTISFMTESGKSAPMIGNIYISSSNTNVDAVYNDIFGNEVDSNNKDQITVNFVKGYGLANKGIGISNNTTDESTNFTKFSGKLDSSEETKVYYLIGYLGKYAPHLTNNDSNVRYYTFYVNAPKNGDYEISGFYNSGENRGLSFWKDSFNVTNANNVAKFKDLNSGDRNWTDKLKSFNHSDSKNNDKSYLTLTQGLNKIIVSGYDNNREAPNLGNVTFTLKQATTETTMMSSTSTSSGPASN
ncbi:hypothetical protein [Mycoplasma bradburyae]|uniref:hypothetical protein n=1 Tax=Mycoplasma bradburyae TaxID=2963128 RepID=UPI0023409872|nr:hypothetical protein [Mycoplasma bradburyae]MDC4183931.1 hypothetical protein [Mycoplasma bradburyae]